MRRLTTILGDRARVWYDPRPPPTWRWCADVWLDDGANDLESYGAAPSREEAISAAEARIQRSDRPGDQPK